MIPKYIHTIMYQTVKTQVNGLKFYNAGLIPNKTNVNKQASTICITDHFSFMLEQSLFKYK